MAISAHVCSKLAKNQMQEIMHRNFNLNVTKGESFMEM